MMKLTDIFADPDFQSLDYSEQQDVKKAYFEQRVAIDSDYQKLAEPDKANIYYSIMDSAPAFEDLGGIISVTPEEKAGLDAGVADVSDYKRAVWLHDRAIMGDEKALGDIQTFAATRTAANQSMIAQLAMGASDLLDKQDTTDPLARDAKNLRKISDYLKSSLDRKGQTTVGNTELAASIGTNIVEGIALNAFVVGNATKVVKTAQGMKTVSGGSWLTKGIFSSLDGVATKMLPGAGKTAMKTVVPAFTEAGLQGVAEIFRQLPTMLQDGSIRGNKELLENVAVNFGTGAVMDIGLYAAGKAFYSTIKPFINSGRKLDLADPISIDAIKKAADDMTDSTVLKTRMSAFLGDPEALAPLEALGGADKEDIIYKINKAGTRMMTQQVDPTTPEGFQKYAMMMQHDVDFVDDKIIISQFDDSNVVFKASTLREANDYLANYIAKTDSTKYMTDLYSAARAKAPEVNVGVSRTTSVTADKLSDTALASSLKPNMNGTVDPKNVKVVVDTMLKRTGIAGQKLEVETVKDMATFLKKSSTFSGNKIYVPKVIQNVNEQNLFADYLHKRLNKLTELYSGDASKLPSIGTFKNGMQALDTLNPINLEQTARALGGELKIAGSTYTLDMPGNAPQIFHSITEAEKALTEMRLSTTGIGIDELSKSLAHTGRSLRYEVQPDTDIGKLFVVDLDGSTPLSAPDVETLLRENPQLMPKLPQYLAPEMSFVGETNKVRLLDNYASGPEQQLRQMLDGYSLDSEKTVKHVEHLVSESKFGVLTGEMLETGKNNFTLEVPEMGFKKNFTSQKAVKDFMDTDLKNFDTLEKIANERGVRLDLAPNGKLMATTRDRKMALLHSKDELHAFMKQYPDPEGAPEFVKLDSSFSDKVIADASDMAKKDIDSMFKDKDRNTFLRNYVNHIDAMIMPMNDTLEEAGRIAGNTMFSEAQLTEIAKDSRFGQEMADRLKGVGLTQIRLKLNEGARLQAIGVRKAELIMKTILKVGNKKLDRTTSGNMMKLLEIHPSQWVEGAKSLKFELTNDHIKLLRNSQVFFKTYSDYFGVDLYKMVSNYGPKIRATMKEYMDNPALHAEFARMTKQDIINKAFGADPMALKTVNFFAKHTRLESFLGEGDNTDLTRAMKFYIDSGMREKYLGPIIKTSQGWFKNLDKLPNVSPQTTKLIETFFKAISGESLSTPDFMFETLSNETTMLISKMFKKFSNASIQTEQTGKFFEALSNRIASKGILEHLNSTVTYATLGMRPLRGLYNMAQFNNTIGIFGHYADEAMRETMDGGILNIEACRQLIYQKMKSGILTTKVFASGHSTTQVEENLLEWSMRNQQNSEFITRAVSARAIEKNFNEVLPFYANGQIDARKFLKESNLNFLDEDVQKNIVQLIADGKPDAASHIAQTEGVRILMGDYDASNYPLMFKGALGKLFGRFGVYPVNQVALYKRMLSGGFNGQTVLRWIRLAAVTTMTYEAFRAMGINYAGFLMTDPFAFSGGPIYKLGQDFLNARDDGPTGALARRELVRSWRLAVPFSSQGMKILDAIDSGSKGQTHQALIEALSGTYTPDSLLKEMIQ